MNGRLNHSDGPEKSDNVPAVPRTDDLDRGHRFVPEVPANPGLKFSARLIRPSGMHVPMIPPVRVPSGKRYPVKFRRTMAAYRRIRVKRGDLDGPRFLLEVGTEGMWRMYSSRGRPTVVDWNIRRLVPFNRRNWRLLGKFGRTIGLSPAQLASLLIERGLHELANEEPRTYFLER